MGGGGSASETMLKYIANPSGRGGDIAANCGTGQGKKARATAFARYEGKPVRSRGWFRGGITTLSDGG